MSTFSSTNVGIADVLDVHQRARLEVVDADHAVAARSNSSHRCEPRNPAPPVTRQVAIGRSLEVHRRPRRRDRDRARGMTRLSLGAVASTPPAGESEHAIAPLVGPDDPRRFTDSGIEVERVYRARATPSRLEDPGEYPFTRGIHAEMYRDAAVDDAPVRRLRVGARVQRALPVPARARLDRPVDGVRSADPARSGLRRPALAGRGRPHRRRDRHDRRHADRVRRDPARRGLDLDDDQRARRACCCASTSWSRRSRASRPRALRGTTQNDILKEYIARGNYIYPPGPSMRLTTDLFAYCRERIPSWNTISISGYHFREKGASAVQEVAFTLAERHRLRAGRARRGPRGRRVRAAARVLLQRPQQRLPGGREVPRGAADVGADHARALRRARRSARRCCASTPRPAASR